MDSNPIPQNSATWKNVEVWVDVRKRIMPNTAK